MEPGCVLQIEDDEDDVLFFALAAETAKLEAPICVARDGHEAIEWFKTLLNSTERKPNRAVVLPRVVLLDLKLPRVMGLQVLRWIRERPVLTQVPVIVLSSSTHPNDLENALKAGADSYVPKPFTLDARIAFAKELKLWFDGEQGLPGSREVRPE